MTKGKNPWILILNGTSSVGKTSLTQAYVSQFDPDIEILALDQEVIPVFIEAFNNYLVNKI